MSIIPFVNEQFSGIIWHLEIDEINELLLLEIRKAEDRSVSFSSVNLSTGYINFKNFTTPERWLTGMESAYNGVLLLHYYQSETGPAHKGLMAVDALTAEVLWTNYAYTFDHLSSDGLIVFDARIQPPKLLQVDVKSGSVRVNHKPSAGRLANSIIWPGLIAGDALPAPFTNIQAVENTTYYLKYNNYKIVSLHALKEGHLSQSLCIAEGNEIIYEDLLNSDIQKIQPEAFILYKNHLIYIKDKSRLIVITL